MKNSFLNPKNPDSLPTEVIIPQSMLLEDRTTRNVDSKGSSLNNRPNLGVSLAEIIQNWIDNTTIVTTGVPTGTVVTDSTITGDGSGGNPLSVENPLPYFTDQSIPFSNPAGILEEDNASFVYENNLDQLKIGDRTVTTWAGSFQDPAVKTQGVFLYGTGADKRITSLIRGQIHVYAEDTTSSITNFHYGTSGLSVQSQYNARGTALVPAAVQSGDSLYQSSAYGYGTSFYQAGRFNFRAAETHSGTAGGSQFSINVTANTTKTLTERLLLDNDGTLFLSKYTDTLVPYFGAGGEVKENSEFAYQDTPGIEQLILIGGATTDQFTTVATRTGLSVGPSFPAETDGAFLSGGTLSLDGGDSGDAFLAIYNGGTIVDNGAEIQLRRYRDTPGTKAAVASGDTLSSIDTYGHNGTGWGLTACMKALATENHTLAGRGSRITFSNTPNASLGLVERLSIENTGQLIASGYAAGAFDNASPFRVVTMDALGGIITSEVADIVTGVPGLGEDYATANLTADDNRTHEWDTFNLQENFSTGTRTVALDSGLDLHTTIMSPTRLDTYIQDTAALDYNNTYHDKTGTTGTLVKSGAGGTNYFIKNVGVSFTYSDAVAGTSGLGLAAGVTTVQGDNINMDGLVAWERIQVSSDITVTPGTDKSNIVVTDTTVGRNITLEASPFTGTLILVTTMDAANGVTILGNGNNINGAASTSIAALYESILLMFTGTEWVIVNRQGASTTDQNYANTNLTADNHRTHTWNQWNRIENFTSGTVIQNFDTIGTDSRATAWSATSSGLNMQAQEISTTKTSYYEINRNGFQMTWTDTTDEVQIDLGANGVYSEFVDGTSGYATYVDVGRDLLELKGGHINNVGIITIPDVTISDGNTLTVNDDTTHLICRNTTGGNVTFNLDLAPRDGTLLFFTLYDATNNLIIDGNGKLISGAATYTMTVENETATLIYSNQEDKWTVLSRYIPGALDVNYANASLTATGSQTHDWAGSTLREEFTNGVYSTFKEKKSSAEEFQIFNSSTSESIWYRFRSSSSFIRQDGAGQSTRIDFSPDSLGFTAKKVSISAALGLGETELGSISGDIVLTDASPGLPHTIVNDTSVPRTLTLPPTLIGTAFVHRIIVTDSTNSVTINGNGNNIAGSPTYVIPSGVTTPYNVLITGSAVEGEWLVLTSSGDIVAEPLNQIVYGTGPSVASEGIFYWDSTFKYQTIGTVGAAATINSPTSNGTPFFSETKRIFGTDNGDVAAFSIGGAVFAQTSEGTAGHYIESVSDTNTNYARLSLRRAKGGDLTAKDPVVSGDVLGSVEFTGIAPPLLGGNPNDYALTAASIDGVTTQNWAGTANGTKLDFYTIPDNSNAKVLNFTVDQNGDLISNNLFYDNSESILRVGRDVTSIPDANFSGFPFDVSSGPNKMLVNNDSSNRSTKINSGLIFNYGDTSSVGMQNYIAGTGSGTYSTYKSTGTGSAPGFVGDATTIWLNNSWVWDGASWTVSNYMISETTEAHSGTGLGSRLRFGVTENGTTSAIDALILNNDGQLAASQYTAVGSFPGTVVGLLGFDSSGNIISEDPATYAGGGVAEPAGQVVYGTGASVTSNSELFYDTAAERFSIGDQNPLANYTERTSYVTDVNNFTQSRTGEGDQSVALIRNGKFNALANGRAAQYNGESYSNDPNNGTTFYAFRARGTNLVPLAISSGDVLLRLDGRGYDGTSFLPALAGASMVFSASENWSGTAHGQKIDFYTAPNGSLGTGGTEVLNFTIDHDGQLIAPQYTAVGSFPGTVVGLLGFDSSGNIISEDPSTYAGGGVAEPANQIVYGTGPGVTSDADFRVDSTINRIAIGATPVQVGRFNPSTYDGFASSIAADSWSVSGVGGADSVYAKQDGFIQFLFDVVSNTAIHSADWAFHKARGTAGALLNLNSGDRIGILRGVVYETTSTYTETASITMEATENQANNSLGTQLIFGTTPNGSDVQATSFIIDHDQTLFAPKYTDTYIPYFGTSGEILESSTFVYDDSAIQQTLTADGNFLSGHVVRQYGALAPVGPTFKGVKYNGTESVPAATGGSNLMIALEGWAYNGTTEAKGATISMDTVGLWSGSNQGTLIEFFTTTSGTTAEHLSLVLEDDGLVAMPEYGVGNFTGTRAYDAAWDSTGDMIEEPVNLSGEVLYVHADGNDTDAEIGNHRRAYATVAQAVTDSSAGDKIIIQSDITITTPITLSKALTVTVQPGCVLHNSSGGNVFTISAACKIFNYGDVTTTSGVCVATSSGGDGTLFSGPGKFETSAASNGCMSFSSADAIFVGGPRIINTNGTSPSSVIFVGSPTMTVYEAYVNVATSGSYTNGLSTIGNDFLQDANVI